MYVCACAIYAILNNYWFERPAIEAIDIVDATVWLQTDSNIAEYFIVIVEIDMKQSEKFVKLNEHWFSFNYPK